MARRASIRIGFWLRELQIPSTALRSGRDDKG
jgi:hypothetical protein